MSSSRLHDVFTSLITTLKSLAKTNSDAGRNINARTWMAPKDWIGDPFDIPKTHLPAFDRTAINENYASVHTADPAVAAGTAAAGPGQSQGTVGDAGSLKIQLEYLSIAERAFRSRHASHIRCLAHTAARDAGHAHEAGVFAQVQNYAQDLSKAGGG